MRTRSLYPALAVLAVVASVLTISVGAGATPVHSQALSQAGMPTGNGTGPFDDTFYTPPNPLPTGQPGDVIRWRVSHAGPRQDTVNAWQVMYLSTDALGHPNAVTGTVLLNKNGTPASAPVVALAPGTQGPAFRCAPSTMIDIGAFYEQPALDDLLHQGYAVAVPDYEGYQQNPKTTYVTGRSEGHAVIDAVRAAQRLPGLGLSATAKVLFRGYSQGGGAAMWAGELQPTYAPELNLVGVVGGGVPADLVQVALGLDGHFGFGLLAEALIGLNHAYPELNLTSYLNDAGKAAFADMEAHDCTLELLVQYQGKHLTDYTTTSPVLDPAWVARYADNKLGGNPIKVPVFQYHATNDNLVDFSQAQTLKTTYCQAGVQLTWKTYPTDHITLIYTGNADALAFVQDRIAGKPATSNC